MTVSPWSRGGRGPARERSVDIMTRTAQYASLTMGGAGYDADGLTLASAPAEKRGRWKVVNGPEWQGPIWQWFAVNAPRL